MRKILPLVSCLSIALVGSAGAALTSADQFLTDPPTSGQYFPGSVSGQGPSVFGYSGSYVGDSSVSVIETGLSYSGVSTAGGALQAVPFGRAGRELSTSYDSSMVGTFYFGFLLQLGETNDGQLPSYSAIELFGAGNVRALQLGASPGDFGTSTNFGLRINDDNGLRMILGAADTNVNLFVIRMDLSADPSADLITVYQNPTDLLSEEGNVPVGVLGGFDLAFNTTTLANFNFNGGNITADELRIGTDFADATAPIPEPGTVALLMMGGVAITLLRRRSAVRIA